MIFLKVCRYNKRYALDFPTGEAYYVSTGAFLLTVYFSCCVIFCAARWSKTASNPHRSKSIGITITKMLTDKEVIGLSGRGESITLQQQRYVGLFGKSSTAIIDPAIHFLRLKAIMRI